MIFLQEDILYLRYRLKAQARVLLHQILKYNNLNLVVHLLYLKVYALSSTLSLVVEAAEAVEM
jgi:hypothetical protein